MRDLRELLASDARGADATPEEAAAALHELSAVLRVLTSRVSQDHVPARADVPAAGDRLLTAAQVAERTGLSQRWLRGRRVPFRVQVSPRRIRYSEAGLEKWVRRQNGIA